MKRKILALFCLFVMLFSLYSVTLSVFAEDANCEIIEESDIPLRLWYESEAPNINDGASHPDYDGLEDDGWQKYSLPIGNGYFGVSTFGRTETERLQITEKTLGNRRIKIEGSEKDISYGGLNNFSETYIDFGHTNVSDYVRYLDMKTAISGVEYTYDEVKYSREYFTSYPDKALVIKLDASGSGNLDFTLRPTVPYEQEYMAVPGDGMGKTGAVSSSVLENNVGYIELSGKLEYFDVDFLGIYKVYTDGGSVRASTVTNGYGDEDGTIVVNGANSAYIVVTLGTDYELSSEIFTSAYENKPTEKTDLDDTRVKVEADMANIEEKLSGKSFNDAYNTLKDAHVKDHEELFGRVTVDLGCNPTDFDIPTDELLASYKSGYNKSTYLEVLLFQYGRYQLIASSREGALPANLQGVWNPYNTAPWGSGYWHNINIQMTYWPAFSTNLEETFAAYVDFNDAFMAKAEANATKNIKEYNPDMLGEDGGNGWVIGVSSFPFSVASDRSAGNLGFTTQMFWEYYQYTQDETVLNEIVLPKLLSAARYITKCVELDENGNYLVSYCDSPEVHVNGEWYYTQGTTYAQTFAYLNNYHVLELMKEIGVDLDKIDEFVSEGRLSADDAAILSTIMEQIDKYDPINVGLSGQIKEFREEDYYGSVGDDPNHRHVSQLVGLYPGNVINSNTPAWLDAALVTLENRGQNTTGGWVYSHKTALYARAKDGDGARARVDELLTRVTSPNLFTLLWDVYQIDASCGVTAGIAEMLLQSNAGYIEPLAALPYGWANGSYKGLCAEGNFEVSAAWENGIAKTFNILSKSGKQVSVAYPSISTANVVRVSDGARVNYTVNNLGRITFDTEVGETYIISGFTVPEEVNNVSNIKAVREGTEAINLSWSTAADVAGYNLYAAFDNDSDYTLVASTTSNSYTFTPAEKNINSRFTFKVKAYDTSGNESDGAICYVNPAELGDEYEKTPHGYINKERYPVEDHPFVVFKDGSLIHTFSDWKLFIDTDINKKSELRSGCIVYLRTDYCVNDDASGKVTGVYRIKDMTLDLGGNTITTGEKYLFQAIGRNDLGFDKTSIEITNGTLKGTTKYAPIVFNDSTDSTGIECFDFLLNNVTLDVSDGIGIARCYGDGTIGAKNSITLNNCTIYRDSNNKSVNLFMLSDNKNILDVSVTINNTKLEASSLSGITFASLDAERESGKGSPDTLRFDENFEVILPSTVAATTTQYKFTDGTYVFAKIANNGTTSSYVLYDVNNLNTQYGTIDVMYASLVDYPFIVFKDRKAIHAFKNWKTFIDTDVNNNVNLRSGCTVLLRRDYVTGEDSSGSASGLYRISDMKIDLGNNVLTSTTYHLFQAIGYETNAANATKTSLKIINGTLRGETKYSPISLNDSTTSTVVETFEFVLENVKLDVSSGISIVRCYGNTGATSGSHNIITLNNCTIYRDSNNAKVTLFSLKYANNPIVNVDVVINGGKLDVSSMSNMTLATYDSGKNDSLSFGTYNGSFVNFVMPKNEAVSKLDYKTPEGHELSVVKASEDRTRATYTLMHKEAADFTPKTSITLSSELVYNVYVPVSAALKSFELDGNTYTELAAFTNIVVLDDGKNYYHFKIELPSAEAARDIVLKAVVTVDGNDYNGTWTLSVPKYAKKVVELESASNVEKTLAKDVLAYIRAAYNYFTEFSNADEIARVNTLIDSIIGEYNAVPVSSGTTNVVAPVKSVTLNLDAKPTIRFYTTDTTVEFFANGKKLNTVMGTDETLGAYVELDVYAYALCETITYTGGSYHISNFINGAAGQPHEALVKAFVKYTESAAAYRASVIGSNK